MAMSANAFTEDIEEIMGKSAQQLAKESQTESVAEAEVVDAVVE